MNTINSYQYLRIIIYIEYALNSKIYLILFLNIRFIFCQISKNIMSKIMCRHEYKTMKLQLRNAVIYLFKNEIHLVFDTLSLKIFQFYINSS